MKNRLKLFCLSLLLYFTAQAQMPKWCIAPHLVDFTGSGPVIATSSLIPSGSWNPSNAAFDKTGNMLFYVRNGQITTPGGVDVGIAIPVSNEIAVVPVPGHCTRFYVIGINKASFGPVYLYYSMVETSGGISIVSGFDNLNLGTVGNEFAALAVSKLRPGKQRFLFTIGRMSPGIPFGYGGANRFLITPSGIRFDTIVADIVGMGWLNRPFEVELYENPSTGSMKLAWGGSYYSSEQMVHVMNLNSSGNFTSYSSASITGLQFVNGLEFFDNGNKLFVCHDNSTPANRGVLVANLISGTSSLISGSTAYAQSQIEKAIDGKYYMVSSTGVLSSVDPSTYAISSTSLNVGDPKLPDQVDDENYIGTNFKAELIARDNTMDIGIEPHSTSDMWASPDIWNRRNTTGSMFVHQNPGYISADGLGNLMKMRVTNIGCSNSAPSYVKMYWTLGSTGEHWPNSWNGSQMVGAAPGGGELTLSSGYSTYTPGSGYAVPALPPGADAVISAKWFPPDPATFASSLVPPDAAICFLGRIDDPLQDPMFDERSSPTTSITGNVYRNNNIVTRNTTLINLNGQFLLAPPPRTSSVLLHSYLLSSHLFDVSFSAISQSSVAFGGLGTITLTVDDNLWNAWIQSGQLSEGLFVSNPQLHELTVTDLTNAVLRGISMNPGDNMRVTLGFALKQPTQITETYGFRISQERSDWQPSEERYGSSCEFIVSTNAPYESDTSFWDQDSLMMLQKGTTGIQTTSRNKVSETLVVIPNPSALDAMVKLQLTGQETVVSVKITDLSGRVIKQIMPDTKYLNKGELTIPVVTSDLGNGIYLVQVQTSKGLRTAKLNVLH